MKVTRRQLRKIIQEESIRALREQTQPEPPEPGKPDKEDREDKPRGSGKVPDSDINWRLITDKMREWGGLLVGMDINVPGRIYAFKKGDASIKKDNIYKLIRREETSKVPDKSARNLGIQFRVEDNSSNTDARLGRKGTNYRLSGDVELVVVAYGAAPK